MSKEASKRQSFNWSAFGSSLSVLVLVLLVGAIVAGLVRGLRPLEDHAARIVATAPSRVTIEWPAMPPGSDGKAANRTTWLAEQFQEELIKRAETALRTSSAASFSRDPLTAVCESMRTSGWFEGVPTVSRRGEGEIHVAGRWRIAAAVVRDGSKDRLISWNAQLMPVEYVAGQSGLPVIEGLAARTPRNSKGQVDFLAAWAGEDITASLELLALMRQQTWGAQVAGIDASKYGKTRQLELLTKSGGRVVWGGRPSAPLRGESTTASKLAKLDRLNRDFRAIDAGRPAVEIFWEAQPLEIDVSATAMKQ